METNIILIGPMRAGKTTVAGLLAQTLNLPHISLDKVKSNYYKDFGYDQAYARQLRDEQGFEALLAYWKPFEIRLVEQILQEYPKGHIIDFGAGHSVYEDEALFKRVQDALALYPYIIFLTPADDAEEAIRILHQRDLDDGESGLPEMNAQFVRHESNRKLATVTIYTKDATPEQTLEAVLAHVQSNA
jgi:shikimate kinase